MKTIYKLSKKYNFSIVEDASHALGGKYENQPVGNCKYSDISIFSFHPVKIITTGEGGVAVTNNKKYDESTKFNLTYNLLNGSRNTRYFKPCFKHYLLNHVKSRFAEVPAPEWEIATFLPTAQWEKSTAGRIYSDSRKTVNG